MSEERGAWVGSAILCRVLKSSLLAAALVCATAQPHAGRAVAPRHAAAHGAALQTRDAGGEGVIAFEAGGEIYVTDLSAGTTNRIVAAKAGVVNMQPALSPDGSRVAFSSNLEGMFRVYVVGVDGGGMRRVTNGPEDDSEPAWSPDGSRIAFVRGFDPTGNGVYVVKCAASGDIIVSDVDAESPSEVYLTGGTDPAWSPDGKRIAFASDRSGSFDIYTMSSEDGGDVRQLTSDEWAEADPAWSPDGSQIAYAAGLRMAGGTQCGTMPIGGTPTGGGDENDDEFEGGGGPYIYGMTADGGEQKNLTEKGGAAGPAWSPDGTQIVFAGGPEAEADVQLYLITSTGGGRWTQLTSGKATKSSPSWSRAVGR